MATREMGYTVRVQDPFPGRLAEVCRRQAALASDGQTRDCLLRMAAEYAAQASTHDLLADALFREESAETFRAGYVFRAGPDLRRARRDRPDWGYWNCDIADGDRLTWSDKVYDLFGVPTGVPVEREWAIGRYSAHSRATLQRVRDFALRHAFGFILDAEIEPEGAGRRWIRVLAIPVPENGRIARLHGLKRAL